MSSNLRSPLLPWMLFAPLLAGGNCPSGGDDDDSGEVESTDPDGIDEAEELEEELEEALDAGGDEEEDE